jgi:hypothetical protein
MRNDLIKAARGPTECLLEPLMSFPNGPLW